MNEITQDELLNREVLQSKLEAYGEQIEEYRKKSGELVDEQAKILTKKLEDFTPIMKFMRENRLFFNHPTLDFHSSLGAILDYDNDKNELYVYAVEERWIQKINLYNQEFKNIPDFIFVQERNLENAINGLNFLLTFQDKAIKEFSGEIEDRQRWIEENK